MYCFQVQVLAIQILLTSHHLLLSADAAIVQPAANGLGDLSSTNSTKANVTLSWFDAATNQTTQNNLPLFELTGLGLNMTTTGPVLSTVFTEFSDDLLDATTPTANDTKWMPLVSCDQPANKTEAIIRKVETLGAKGIIFFTLSGRIMCAFANTPGSFPTIPIYTAFDATGFIFEPIKKQIDSYFASTPSSLKTYNASQFDTAWPALSDTLSALDAGRDTISYPPAVLARVFSEGPATRTTTATGTATSTRPSMHSNSAQSVIPAAGGLCWLLLLTFFFL